MIPEDLNRAWREGEGEGREERERERERKEQERERDWEERGEDLEGAAFVLLDLTGHGHVRLQGLLEIAGPLLGLGQGVGE